MTEDKRDKELKKIESVLDLYFDSEEVLEREVTKFGNSGHVSMPSKHVGKQTKIFVLKNKEEKKQ